MVTSLLIKRGLYSICTIYIVDVYCVPKWTKKGVLQPILLGTSASLLSWVVCLEILQYVDNMTIIDLLFMLALFIFIPLENEPLRNEL